MSQDQRSGDVGRPSADELAWLRRFIVCSVFGPPPDEVQRALKVLDSLAHSSTNHAELIAIHEAVMNPEAVTISESDTLTVRRVKEFVQRAFAQSSTERDDDARERLRLAMLFIEEWANWWSYALQRPAGKPVTLDEDAAAQKMAQDLGARARTTVINNRMFLARSAPSSMTTTTQVYDPQLYGDTPR